MQITIAQLSSVYIPKLKYYYSHNSFTKLIDNSVFKTSSMCSFMTASGKSLVSADV